MEGSLSKWTNVMKGWQYRWFVLDDHAGLMTYYTSREKRMRGARRGCVRLKGAVIGIDDEDDSTFTITVDQKTFHFQARDAEEREKWVRALEETIFRHGNRLTWYTHNSTPSIKDFDNKVAEADAYLQLMIEQTKLLENKIQSVEDKDEKNKCQVILDHANDMLNNIKHSIVLLQIVKNTAHPVNGIYQPSALSIKSSSPIDLEAAAMVENIQSGIELGSECLENLRRVRNTLSPTSSLAVPDVSYSSSEGEEDFFDANDLPFSYSNQKLLPSTNSLRSFDDIETTSKSPQILQPQQSSVAQTASTTNTNTNSNTTNTESAKIGQKQDSIASKNSQTSNLENLDYDALYEDDEESSNVEMDSHGSVIRHLLSQVKIGMDLTKVVLPTFILERRSLLEMYADYFAHPDLFVAIADFKEPKERFVQVVRWYLSSYHAGRKSSVAKKPYNPILGEIFRCHWNLTNTATPSNSGTSITNNDINGVCNSNGGSGRGGVVVVDKEHALDDDRPMPWCGNNELVFVAEQVSHHPPISAFYAEHYEKRISFNAHVYTKSKFLGLSVCVYNIGRGVVSLLDHDEDYVVTFPNGYGRSILTVPWIELGGSVTITCQKTGYTANIEFITKPFYGNKKHRITADLFGPDDVKKPFLSISGEWNGVMDAKCDEKEAERFVDVNALSAIKKQVKPIGQQLENESRRLWKEVTAGLRFNDIERATNAKQKLEQKQRDEAKERKDTANEWQTKLFHKSGEDAWMYNKPLHLRLNNK